ncbi:MAG: type II toxin-antitoxin system YafQ family toxin [Paludibacteraceae bacterium]|nr:type II toxin-antitoxin system YafQ family toxin [Paludibacteraceae bacterium]
MYSVQMSKGFRKNAELCRKRGLDMTLLRKAIETLAMNGKLPASYKPHKLTGIYAGCWECHLQPDWLMVWQQEDEQLTLLFLRTGTHSDIF